MTRYGLLKKFLSVIEETDVVIFSGKELCEEAYENDASNCFYLNSNKVSISFALGIAVSCENRVFLVCDANSVISEMNSLLQVIASKQSNVFIVMVSNTDDRFFNLVSHKQGMFFDMGFKSFVLDKYFESSKDLNNLKLFLENMKGPIVFNLTLNTTHTYP